MGLKKAAMRGYLKADLMDPWSADKMVRPTVLVRVLKKERPLELVMAAMTGLSSADVMAHSMVL